MVVPAARMAQKRVPHGMPHFGIQARRPLVQNQYARMGQQRQDQRQALLFPAREGLYHLPGLFARQAPQQFFFIRGAGV